MLYIERYKYLIKFKIEGKQQRQQNSGWCGVWFLFDGGNQPTKKRVESKKDILFKTKL